MSKEWWPKYHKPTDVYSFALLAWETFSGIVPFTGKRDTDIVDMHKEAYYGEEPVQCVNVRAMSR